MLLKRVLCNSCSWFAFQISLKMRSSVINYIVLVLACFLALQLYIVATRGSKYSPQLIRHVIAQTEGYPDENMVNATSRNVDSLIITQQSTPKDEEISQENMMKKQPTSGTYDVNVDNQRDKIFGMSNNQSRTSGSNHTQADTNHGISNTGKIIGNHGNRSHGKLQNGKQILERNKNEVLIGIVGDILKPRVRHKLRDQLQMMSKQPERNMKTSDESDVYTYDESSHKSVRKPLGNYSKSCTVMASVIGAKPKAPFKIYVYDLPPEWNTDVVQCLAKYPCYNTDHCGMGPYIASNAELNIYNTWQFSLEVVLHHKFLASYYRTYNASDADLFYIPYYGAANCFCYRTPKPEKITQDLNDLVDFLNNSSFYREGKPHVMAISKIEREQDSQSCPTMKFITKNNIRFLGIEARLMTSRRYYTSHPLTVVPYPSYAHLNDVKHGAYVLSLQNRTRSVFAFLAAGTRRSNHFRNLILDQFKDNLTKFGLPQYFSHYKVSANTTIEKVWLGTPECNGKHHEYTLQWMTHSVFCIQPPGDSPTRKSFFDSIASGCIPVIFQAPFSQIYPFTKTINYKKFTVFIPASRIERGESVLKTLKEIKPRTIQAMQAYLQTVIRYFQYSFPLTDFKHDDAMVKILEELQDVFKIQSRS